MPDALPPASPVASRPFVIFTNEFDENIGGAIALHRLCHLLNTEGHAAYLWPQSRPRHDPARPLRSLWKRFSHWVRRKDQRRFKTWPGFNTPLASRRHLRESIVVYAEVIDGNPLDAKRVVRWLLHKPGFHTGRVNFGPTDRFFFFQHAFNDPVLNPDSGNLLKAMFVRDDIYRQTNFGPREGTCYFLRKGRDRAIVHSLDGSVLADDLSHAELAALFNRVHTCISYDLYTMYSNFAALCGCVSVVVPQEGLSKEQWYPDEEDRYGVAYGFDDLEWAERTRPLLLPHIKAREQEANASVKSFVEKCAAYFPPGGD